MAADTYEQQVRADWRKLGFFYDRNDDAKEWRIVGSRQGLLRFARLLRDYVADPVNEMKSEHEHYGPHRYLEVMTWPEAGLDNHSIHGSLGDLARLASIVEAKAADLAVGEAARLRREFALGAAYELALELVPDGFDPASLDRSVSESAG